VEPKGKAARWTTPGFSGRVLAHFSQGVPYLGSVQRDNELDLAFAKKNDVVGDGIFGSPLARSVQENICESKKSGIAIQEVK
jgi:hypothetical protein